jgi:WG containing repeat
VITLQLMSCQQIKIISKNGSVSSKASAIPQPEITPHVEPGNENLKYGFIDRTGQFVITPKFRVASCFKGGLAPVITDKGHAFLNKGGQFITNPGEFITTHGGNCDDTWPNYLEGLYSVWNNFRLPGAKDSHQPEIQSYFGYVNAKGKLVIPLVQYSYAEDFSDGMAKVSVITQAAPDEIEAAKRRGAGYTPGTREGYIDTSGKLVIPAQFYRAERFQWGIAKVGVERYEIDSGKTGQKKTVLYYSFIDRKGRYLVDFAPTDAGFSCKVSDQLLKNYQTFIGKDAFAKNYPKLKKICNAPDFWKIRDGFKLLDITLLPSTTDIDQVLANQTGKQLFPGKSTTGATTYYQRVDRGINEGLALIERDDGLKCYINNQGDFVIPCKFKEASAFSEGLAAVAIEIDPKKK